MNFWSLVCALFALAAFLYVAWRTKSVTAAGFAFLTLSWMLQLLILNPDIHL